MSSNSCTVKPVNDLKSSGFLDNLLYESKKKGQEIKVNLVIYLFILISKRSNESSHEEEGKKEI